MPMQDHRRSGISLVETIIALAVLATLTASLASSIMTQNRLRQSVTETLDSLALQSGMQETLLAVPVSDLSTAAWATAAQGCTQPVTETEVLDPVFDAYATSVTQLVSSGIIAAAERAPASLRAFVQYHWATTTAGHRGLLDTGLDGSDADSAPDAWPSDSAARAGMGDPGVLGSSLIPDGVGGIPDGSPFVVRVVLAWDDEGRGDILGRRIAGASASGASRVTTIFTARIK